MRLELPPTELTAGVNERGPFASDGAYSRAIAEINPGAAAHVRCDFVVDDEVWASVSVSGAHIAEAPFCIATPGVSRAVSSQPRALELGQEFTLRLTLSDAAVVSASISLAA